MRFMTNFHENPKAESSLEIKIFTFSSSFMEASKENREQLSKIFIPAHSSHGHKSSSSHFLQT